MHYYRLNALLTLTVMRKDGVCIVGKKANHDEKDAGKVDEQEQKHVSNQGRSCKTTCQT